MSEILAKKDESTDILKVKILSGQGKIPIKGSPNAAGYDLFAAEDRIIQPSSREIIHTDIAIELPLGTYGRIAPRSGLSITQSLDIGAGVIDPDFRGNLGVVLINSGPRPFFVKRGYKIAQLILEEIRDAKIVVTETLTDTKRDQGSYGSTGM